MSGEVIRVSGNNGHPPDHAVQPQELAMIRDGIAIPGNDVEVGTSPVAVNLNETVEPGSVGIGVERGASNEILPSEVDSPARYPVTTLGAEILPGESRDEFWLLHQDLTREWAASGPIEADAVLTLAIDLWRKRRFRCWRQRRLAFDAQGQRRQDLEYLEKEPKPFPEQPGDNIIDWKCGTTHIDDFVALLNASNQLMRDNDQFYIELVMITMLPQKYIEHLEATVPRAKYTKYTQDRDYARGLKAEIDQVLLPKARQELREKFGSIDDEKLIMDAMNPERLTADLVMESRLDAAVDRSIKRLQALKISGQSNALEPRSSMRRNSRSAAGWGRIRWVN